MRHIKSRGVKIGETKFQLIGSNGEQSKEFNIIQTSKKKLSEKAELSKKME